MKSVFSVAVLLTAVGSAMAQSNVLLLIDNTDPSNVTVSATGAAPDVNASIDTINGVTLIGLFADPGLALPISTVIGGDLIGGGAPGAFNRGGNNFGTLSANDLNFWGSGVGGTQTYSTGSPAFTGAATGNYTGATFNASGDIRLGDTVTGVVLGQWQLIPTPGAVALFSVAGLAATRRRRG